jgi:hypothetical protein
MPPPIGGRRAAVIGQCHCENDKPSAQAQLAGSAREEISPILGRLLGVGGASRSVAAKGGKHVIGDRCWRSAQPVQGLRSPSQRHAV